MRLAPSWPSSPGTSSTGATRRPTRALHTWRSRLLRSDGAQRDPRAGEPLARGRVRAGDRGGALVVCLLQEVPAAWAPTLARRCGARLVACRSRRATSSRRPRRLAALEPGPDRLLGGRLEPDARPAAVADRRDAAARCCSTRSRARASARAAADGVRAASRWRGRPSVCVANLHATRRPARAGRAGGAARGRDGGRAGRASAPLLLGGDFNLRPRADDGLRASSSAIRPRARRRRRDRPPARSRARGVEPATRLAAGAPRARGAASGARPRRLRLSDHAPVEATFVRCDSV